MRTPSSRTTKLAASLSLLVVLLGSAGTASSTTGCSSKICTQSEEQACTNAYTACVERSVAAAGAGCQKCIDDYCSCFDSCGTTCDREKYAGTCNVGGGG